MSGANVSPVFSGVLTTDNVNHPNHYTAGSIECIDAIDAATSDKPGEEAPYVANVIKYVWRYNRKGGVESLKKARWYLDRLISKLDPVPKGTPA